MFGLVNESQAYAVARKLIERRADNIWGELREPLFLPINNLIEEEF
jgi:hypothetical protein